MICTALCEVKLATGGVPEISVVIPTHGRPETLARAIRSILAQTYDAFEIVVVMDGEDPSTLMVVERFLDSRIRLIQLDKKSGGGSARNAGVVEARGKWIAFLDDDDEFRPGKLKLQLAMAKRVPAESSLVVCSAVVRNELTEVVWPERFPRDNESLCDYLFCRSKLHQGEGFLQTSTYFVSRELAMRVPFNTELPRHQDWDWILRLESAGVRVVAVAEPLTIYYHGGAAPSVSRARGWQTSLAWAREMVLPRSRPAYAFFIATQCVSRFDADDCWSRTILRRLARECFVAGESNVVSATLFAMFWMRAMVRGSSRAGRNLREALANACFSIAKRGYTIR